MNTTEVLAHNFENGVAIETQGLALAPLVDKIAYGIAKGLVVAMKELENHIASENRKVADSVGLRLDGLISEQRAFNTSIQEKHQELALRVEEKHQDLTRRVDTLRGESAAAAASLREADAQQASEIESLRAAAQREAAALAARIEAVCKDLTIQQDDIAAIKSTLSTFSATFQTFAERLDRQADALRSMAAAYAQRETELESLVDGLARLRAYPAPAPMDRL